MDFTLRLATPADVAALHSLIARSIRGLGVDDYSRAQIDAALIDAFGVDTALIFDGTYFVAEVPAGDIVACGGWSRRRKLFGSDARAEQDEPWLDPAAEAAKIRAFFVDPAYARQGIGRMLLERCELDARRAGFASFALMATLPGMRLYQRYGYVADAAISYPLPGGLTIEFIPMRKSVSPPPPHVPRSDA